ncbi:MAG: cellulose synthase family protein [Planctomycetota bacterium]|jgi:cellulose synthase/poly-beta-1,6-N-acetylglucosamine synthase-like glycosyltransferase
MDWQHLAQTMFMSVYIFVMVMVSIYGLHRYGLVLLYYRHRRKVNKPSGYFEELPHVTVQLPMYNERLVARRIVAKTCEIDYPREKLQMQVLDDSTDDTCVLARAAVEEFRAKGFDIEYIHRDNREGYKAGALANGLKTAKGEFITIFDADFLPEPSILRRSIDYFADPRVCVVQARWEHLNRNDSLLTRSQAIFLDGHFAIEHVARNRSERFMSFNGTAGTWRRAAIDDAGGWQHDTLTEDLDLSYRAQLKGWKFVFLPDLTAPAELPPEMSAFKAQQFRWTKGGAQTAMKLLPKVMLSKLPLKVKVEAFFHLTCFTMHIYMLLMISMLFPAIMLRYNAALPPSIWRSLFDVSVFVLATLSASLFYVASQVELFGDWRTAVKYLPVMMAVGVGLCISNTKAIIEALFGKKSEFVRTPKYGGKVVRLFSSDRSRKKRRRSLLPYVEFLFGLYMCFCVVACFTFAYSPLTAPFLLMFAFGFFYVSVMSLLAERTRIAARKKAEMSPVGQEF